MGWHGPNNPHAAPNRANFVAETDDEGARQPVQLSLESLLPMSSQDSVLAATQHVWSELCTPWPQDASMFHLEFLEYLPDLSSDFVAILSIVPLWTGEPVQRIHVFVDGSSFQNRSVPGSQFAAWSFIVVVECNVQDRTVMRFVSATSHSLSGANEHQESFVGVGEFLQDALTAEATGMVWTVA